MTQRRPRRLPTLPGAKSLHEAALAYLARFAASEARLAGVLERRIIRWTQAAEAQQLDRMEIAAAAAVARAAASEVVARLAASGAVNDAAFAAARARRLVRSGRSRRAVLAHLAARGVKSDAAAAALPVDPARELAAALAVARRRRIGPFRVAPGVDGEAKRRELGVLARAGFSGDVAKRALDTDRGQAEQLISELRLR